MKKFEKLLKGHRDIVFLDLEATQFSHEMIALGAVMVTIDKNLKIKKWRKPFKIFVKAKNKIGKIVTNMTGITEDLLTAEGVSFADALLAFKKYLGLHFKKASFVTFGNHDLTILNRTISYNFDFNKDICSQIQRNYVDFLAFLNEFVKDSKGNQISLVHFCEMFNVDIEGPEHDPQADAINLARLFEAVITNKAKLLEEYKKVLAKFSHFPEPIRVVVARLIQGETISPSDLEEEIKKFIA